MIVLSIVMLSSSSPYLNLILGPYSLYSLGFWLKDPSRGLSGAPCRNIKAPITSHHPQQDEMLVETLKEREKSAWIINENKK